ncbi:CLUMA_CG000342, isoform A [Clunio marinus]|uniref:CLUMA_CG000342, isoform A n=1 Tax=Clunio marinus TaxID=568069 RepID=A0A1J1HE62_9DIPT|nr:CLUMA_CG000342, isoform A [Clunio marinus]
MKPYNVIFLAEMLYFSTPHRVLLWCRQTGFVNRLRHSFRQIIIYEDAIDEAFYAKHSSAFLFRQSLSFILATANYNKSEIFDFFPTLRNRMHSLATVENLKRQNV